MGKSVTSPVAVTDAAPATTMSTVAANPMRQLPRSFPARKSTGRTEDRMISTTREDFSSVTRAPTRPAKVMIDIMTTKVAMKTVKMSTKF